MTIKQIGAAVRKARGQRSISEKQAWCVAFDFIAISKLSF